MTQIDSTTKAVADALDYVADSIAGDGDLAGGLYAIAKELRGLAEVIHAGIERLVSGA